MTPSHSSGWKIVGDVFHGTQMSGKAFGIHRDTLRRAAYMEGGPVDAVCFTYFLGKDAWLKVDEETHQAIQDFCDVIPKEGAQ